MESSDPRLGVQSLPRFVIAYRSHMGKNYVSMMSKPYAL